MQGDSNTTFLISQMRGGPITVAEFMQDALTRQEVFCAYLGRGCMLHRLHHDSWIPEYGNPSLSYAHIQPSRGVLHATGRVWDVRGLHHLTRDQPTVRRGVQSGGTVGIRDSGWLNLAPSHGLSQGGQFNENTLAFMV